MKFLTFGEIMLRLKAPGQECFFQSPMLEATFGGGEANVAVSLANYGEDAAFLTVLPDNAIADACKAELRRFDVDTKRIVTGEGRMGIYYLEGGANQRPSKVVYDRAWSAIALAKPGDIDWDKAFDGVAWFHITGITPAISESAMELSLESVKEAKKRGMKVIVYGSASETGDKASRHSSGKNLFQLADIVVDSCVPLVDASVPLKNHFDKVGPLSTLSFVTMVWMTITTVAEILADRGVHLYIHPSHNVPGDTTAHERLDAAIAEYQRKVKCL